MPLSLSRFSVFRRKIRPVRFFAAPMKIRFYPRPFPDDFRRLDERRVRWRLWLTAQIEAASAARTSDFHRSVLEAGGFWEDCLMRFEVLRRFRGGV